MKLRALLGAAAFAVALSTPAHAQFDITFDEVAAGTLADGLTIEGVTFGFPTTDAAVGFGPGCIVWVCDPSLEGDVSRILSMSFSGAGAYKLGFGIARSGPAPATTFVALYDASNVAFLVRELTLTVPQGGIFPELRFNWTSMGQFAVRAEIRHASPEPFERFALDNIQGTVVPEPGTVALLGTGLVGLVLAGRRRSA
ncbi:MAG: PEP-CTERM sorting domain-containing protein [Gemmatimonadales bacterium]|nr:PEP-CTERM sorting domain-containing protein [Gemmatimonadales bacterium]